MHTDLKIVMHNKTCQRLNTLLLHKQRVYKTINSSDKLSYQANFRAGSACIKQQHKIEIERFQWLYSVEYFENFWIIKISKL